MLEKKSKNEGKKENKSTFLKFKIFNKSSKDKDRNGSL